VVIDQLDTLIARVMEEDSRKYDLLADTRRMSLGVVVPVAEEGREAPPRYVNLDVDRPGSGTESFVLTPHALGQMSTDLGIPKRYLDRMVESAPDLFRSNVHHWMYQEPNRRLIRAYTQPEGEQPSARAWLSDRYRRLDNIEIAKRLLPEFGDLGTEVRFHQASITDEKFFLRAVFPRLEADIRVGDPVQWGVQIRNSEVGAGTFAIESFVLQLVCMNGMVVSKVLNARHVGKRLGDNLSDEAIRADDKAFWLAARDELRASISEQAFQNVLATLRQTTDGVEIKQPIAATERLAKEFSLTEEEREAVLLSLASGGDMSRWGAISAITASAQKAEAFDRRVEMEEIGWDLANASQKTWERIAVAA